MSTITTCLLLSKGEIVIVHSTSILFFFCSCDEGEEDLNGSLDVSTDSGPRKQTRDVSSSPQQEEWPSIKSTLQVKSETMEDLDESIATISKMFYCDICPQSLAFGDMDQLEDHIEVGHPNIDLQKLEFINGRMTLET